MNTNISNEENKNEHLKEFKMPEVKKYFISEYNFNSKYAEGGFWESEAECIEINIRSHYKAQANEQLIYICKAVNEYDKLKEQNKRLLEALKRVKDVLMLHSGTKVFSDDFENEIRQTIKLAEQ